MIDLSIEKLRERIQTNEYVPYENAEGRRVVNICGVEVSYRDYDKFVTRLYSAYNPEESSYMAVLNGESMCAGDIQSLLQYRYVAEMMIPGSTQQGIKSFKLYGRHPYMVDPSLPLQDKASKIFKASSMSGTTNPWLTMEGREDLALNYTIDQNELKRAIREDISQGKVKEGYCIPGGILGLQVLLIGADAELLLEAQDVVRYSIATLKTMGKSEKLSDDLKSQAQKLKEIQEQYTLFVATAQNQKSESENLFDF